MALTRQIRPRPDALMVTQPPSPFTVSRLAWLCGRWLRPIAARIHARSRLRSERRLEDLVCHRIPACRDRADLERLVGPPRWAISERDYYGVSLQDDAVRSEDSTPHADDLIECYRLGDIFIRLTFRSGSLWRIEGSVFSQWDIVLDEAYWETRGTSVDRLLDEWEAKALGQTVKQRWPAPPHSS